MSEKDKKTEKKGKGLLGTLKSLAFEESGDNSIEESTESVSTKTTDDSQSSKFVYTNQVANIVPGVNVNGQFDEQFYKDLLKVLEDNNIDGVDYLEFSKAKKAMDSIPGMNEPLKYQSTFAQLKANSTITKETLLKTADHYIDKLGQEEIHFNAEMQRAIKNEVESRNQLIQEKSDSIKKKQEQIAALNSEINNLSAEIGTTQNEAQLAQAKIDATAKNFKVTLETVKSQIALDKQNIQNFIQ